jgi:glycopeptide antibiotics resistance protein
MNNLSSTQINNIAMFAGLLAVILAKFNVNITKDELQMSIGLVVALIFNIRQYIHRYKKGDLTLAGFRK